MDMVSLENRRVSRRSGEKREYVCVQLGDSNAGVRNERWSRPKKTVGTEHVSVLFSMFIICHARAISRTRFGPNAMVLLLYLTEVKKEKKTYVSIGDGKRGRRSVENRKRDRAKTRAGHCDLPIVWRSRFGIQKPSASYFAHRL